MPHWLECAHGFPGMHACLRLSELRPGLRGSSPDERATPWTGGTTPFSTRGTKRRIQLGQSWALLHSPEGVKEHLAHISQPLSENHQDWKHLEVTEGRRVMIITSTYSSALLPPELSPFSHFSGLTLDSKASQFGPLLSLLYWARVPSGAAERQGLTQEGALSAILLL